MSSDSLYNVKFMKKGGEKMKKLFQSIAGAGTALVLSVGVAFGATYSVDPWTYDPGNTGSVESFIEDGELHLEKNAPTSTNAAAGAELQGVEGLSTTDLTLSFEVDGYCGSGAPRFNVYLEDGQTIFLGCVHGDANQDGTVVFEAGNTYGGVLFPEGETVTGIDIVQDEEGQTVLSNIMVNGQSVVLPNLPTSKDACKNGGYQNLTDASGNTFRNQGQCVSYFNHL